MLIIRCISQVEFPGYYKVVFIQNTRADMREDTVNNRN